MSRSIAGTTIVSFIDNELGHVVDGACDSIGAGLPTTTLTFARGCKIVDRSTSIVWVNVGTSTTPSWDTIHKTMGVNPATIATTSNTDAYVIVPETGVLASIDFSGVDALATSDTNYITFTVTNLGQAGAGSTAMLATSPAGVNTTKATGGTAIAANTKYPLTLASTGLAVTAGDRLRIRAAATGTLANTVTFPAFMLRFNQTLV